MNYIEYLTNWIRDYVKSANADGIVIGISGGIDSALASAIAKLAFPNNVLGVIMPIENMGQHYNDALDHVKQFNIDYQTIDLTDEFEFMRKKIAIKSKMAIANIKPRLRMTTLYALAQEKNYLVMGTDNADELLLGYFTKYGDGGVDLLPLANLTKTQVRELSKIIGISDNIINKKPSADLWAGQTDEDEMGITYKEVDDYICGNQVSEKAKNRIEYLNKISEHKRKPIPTPERHYKF